MRQLLNQESEKQAKDLEIYIPPGPRLGEVVVESKTWPKPMASSCCMRG